MHWFKWLLTAADPNQFSLNLLPTFEKVTTYQIKKIFLKIRNICLNFVWVFNCFVTLSYPIIDGQNSYLFEKLLNKTSSIASLSQGIFFLCRLEKIERFLKKFFSFSNFEIQIMRNLIIKSGYVELVQITPEQGHYMVYYDSLLTMFRYTVLSPEGKSYFDIEFLSNYFRKFKS